jgi:hypothetical protein
MGDDAQVADFTEARAILSRSVDAGAFPGAVYAVGRGSEVVAFGAVGNMSAEFCLLSSIRNSPFLIFLID